MVPTELGFDLMLTLFDQGTLQNHELVDCLCLNLDLNDNLPLFQAELYRILSPLKRWFQLKCFALDQHP